MWLYSRDRSHGASHHGAAEGVIPGQPVTEAVGQAQDPLAYRHRWEHPVDEMGGALGHAPPPTARTKPSPVAGKRYEPIEPTPRASKPREAAAGCPAPQEVAELLLNEVGQALAVAEIGRLRPKRLEVIAHHLMQNACCRLPRLVGRQREGHAQPSAEPVPGSADQETWGVLDDQAHDRAVSALATGTAGSRLWKRLAN